MPSYTAITAISSLAFASLSAARPIPHTVTLFRRAILDINDGLLVVQNKDAPKTYKTDLEPYDQYHFRYLAIGCADVDKHQTFFETCCQPRSAYKIDDGDYPMACRLNTYRVYEPVYGKDEVVAKLGSLTDYKDKLQSNNANEAVVAQVPGAQSSSSSSWSSSSSAEPSSSWSAPPSSSSTWSSSTPAYTPSSSSSWSSSTPAYTPQSSSSTWSSSTPAYTPSSSSSQSWSAPSSSSSSSSWVAPSSAETWSSSSARWHAAAAVPSSSSAWASAPAAAAPTTSANSNNNAGAFSGTASWFTQNGNPGACGVYNPDSANIVAIKTDLYGWTGQKSQYCGRSLTITNTATGATAQAVVADACPGCSSYYSLDLSTGLFQQLGSLDQGLLPISWHWN